MVVARREALHSVLQLPGLLVQTRQRQSRILSAEQVLHLYQRPAGGGDARAVPLTRVSGKLRGREDLPALLVLERFVSGRYKSRKVATMEIFWR